MELKRYVLVFIMLAFIFSFASCSVNSKNQDHTSSLSEDIDKVDMPEWYSENLVQLVANAVQNPPSDMYTPSRLALMDIDNDGIPELFIGYWQQQDKFSTIFYWAYSIVSLTPIYSSEISEDEGENYFVRQGLNEKLFNGTVLYENSDQRFFVSYFFSGNAMGPVITATKLWNIENAWYSITNDYPMEDGTMFEIPRFDMVYVSNYMITSSIPLEETIKTCVADYICRYDYFGEWTIPSFYPDFY